jgi:hypothetical protein
MSAAPDYDFTWPGRPMSGLAGLLDAASAAVGQLADGADLDHMADRDAAAVMGALTTLVGRLDGCGCRWPGRCGTGGSAACAARGTWPGGCAPMPG